MKFHLICLSGIYTLYLLNVHVHSNWGVPTSEFIAGTEHEMRADLSKFHLMCTLHDITSALSPTVSKNYNFQDQR